jgi:peptidyl-prolyl cis-trans isomerase C
MKTVALTCLIAVLGLAACQQKAAAPAAASEGPPVATVNGTPIGREFFEFYVKGISGGKTSKELSPEQRTLALDNLVRVEVLAQQADKDGVTKEKDFVNMLELQRLNLLQQVSSERYLKDKKPTEQELRAEYETQVATLPHTEYRARHILVATEAFAKKLIEQLDKDKGASFADLAKKESMDSSKDNGGDLGWFTPERMDKAFSDAVVALKPGEYTHTPVQTQFGWHIIKLDDTRELAAPPYDSVRQRLEQIVSAKKFKAYADDLTKNAKVEKTTS